MKGAGGGIEAENRLAELEPPAEELQGERFDGQGVGAGAEGNIHGLQGQEGTPELVDADVPRLGKRRASGAAARGGPGIVKDGQVGRNAEEERLRQRLLDVHAGELDPAADRKGVAGLADGEGRAERALELHPRLLGNAGLASRGNRADRGSGADSVARSNAGVGASLAVPVMSIEPTSGRRTRAVRPSIAPESLS